MEKGCDLMKKVFLIVMIGLALILGLIACNKESSKTYSFRGKIVEMYMNNLIVEPLENEEIRRSADKIQVWIGQTPEFHPPIFPAGTLVEIEYDGNVDETYPAQINAISLRTIDENGTDIIPPILEANFPTTVAYANWAENEGGLSQDENCLNAEKYIFSDYPRLPVFKFDTKAKLDEFKNKYQDTFTMDHGHDEVASFDEVTEKYDDAFFENHSLMLTYKEASSGSFRYAIDEVVKEADTLVLKIEQTNHPEVYTDDMAGWFLMAEVSKEDIQDCKAFDAYDMSGVTRDLSENEVGYEIVVSKNDITLEKGEEASFDITFANPDESSIREYITCKDQNDMILLEYGALENHQITVSLKALKAGTTEIVVCDYNYPERKEIVKVNVID